MRNVLLDEETDAVLAPNAVGTWVEVKGFSVYIFKTDEGIAVSICAKGYEDCDSLSSCDAADCDAHLMQKEDE